MILNDNQISEIGIRIREHLEQCWREFHHNYIKVTAKLRGDTSVVMPSVQSTFTCRHTSLFVIRLLKELGVDDLKHARGKMLVRDGFEKTYMENFSVVPSRLTSQGDNIWEEHSWIEHNGMFFDITADQFGYEPVFVIDMSKTEGIYRHNKVESKMSVLNSVKGAADKFRGVTTSLWQDADPHFAAVAASFEYLKNDLGTLVGNSRPKFS